MGIDYSHPGRQRSGDQRPHRPPKVSGERDGVGGPSGPVPAERKIVSTRKQIEFEIGQRTYRVITSLRNVYDVHGFNSLREDVGIYKDLISGEKLFVTWSLIPVLRYIDIAEDDEEDDDEEDDDEAV
jgi:hypothetical protein